VIPSYVESLNSKQTFVSDEPDVTEYLKSSTNLRFTLSLEEGLDYSDQLFVLLPQQNDRKSSNKQIVIGCTVLPGYISGVARFLISDCHISLLF